MSDPDRTRPALPDPQRDRHVSFPDDASSADPAPAPVGAALPPEAWAPRSAHPAAERHRTSSWQPAVPPVLTTPPVRQPPQRRVPGWVALLLVPPLLIGLSNHNAATETYDCRSYDAGPGVSYCDGTIDGTVVDTTGGDGDVPGSMPGVWVEPVSDTGFGEVLTGKPQVRPVPADASLLRVEVVATTGLDGDVVEAQVDTTAGDFTLDSSYGPLPRAFEIHLDERAEDLSVSAAVGSGTVQCRIYADDVLVAVSTSDSLATCTPKL